MLLIYKRFKYSGEAAGTYLIENIRSGKNKKTASNSNGFFKITYRKVFKRFPTLELPRSGSTGLISGFSATPSHNVMYEPKYKSFRKAVSRRYEV
jgi:hypothetical protein